MLTAECHAPCPPCALQVGASDLVSPAGEPAAPLPARVGWESQSSEQPAASIPKPALPVAPLPPCPHPRRELPWSTTGPWQLVNLLMNGGHLEVPPREELPGTDTPAFEGLDAYIALMK